MPNYALAAHKVIAQLRRKHMPDISIGFDLATSASIIGASIAYLLSERKRRTVEREWRRELISQKQIELSHATVVDVLNFLPVITGTMRKVNEGIKAQRHSPLPDGTALISPEAAARAIREDVIQLRDRIEFELLRPLEVKVDFVEGHDVWNIWAAKCQKRLDTVAQAMDGLVDHCARLDLTIDAKQKLLEAAVPLLLGPKPTGGQIHSVHAAVIELARDVKLGLLAMQPN